jgi:hypothetical protein
MPGTMSNRELCRGDQARVYEVLEGAWAPKAGEALWGLLRMLGSWG